MNQLNNLENENLLAVETNIQLVSGKTPITFE